MNDKTIQFSLSLLLAYDLIALLITCLPGTIAWSMGILYLHHIWQSNWIFIKLFLIPVIVYFSFISIIFILRLLLPKITPGVYKAGFNRGVVSWYLHFALGRAARVAMLTSLIQLFYFTKYLYWRVLGAKISYKVNTSINVNFVDNGLITIGANSTLGAEVTITCHAWVGDKLILAPVKIGQNVFVGAYTQIGLNSVIKDNAWIGHTNIIYDETIPENTKIDSFEWRFGNPSKESKI